MPIGPSIKPLIQGVRQGRKRKRTLNTALGSIYSPSDYKAIIKRSPYKGTSMMSLSRHSAPCGRANSSGQNENLGIRKLGIIIIGRGTLDTRSARAIRTFVG
jgi:hypothetical protein